LTNDMMQDTLREDRVFMGQAIRLAMRGLGRTAPNPPVGSIIVDKGKVVGEGFHPKAGMPHAEVYALRAAGGAARGASMYVTLEPCVHHGKTPPCVDAIISAGIKRVVIGAADPNPVVKGKGIEKLKAHGIDVSLGVMQQECEDLISWYTKWMVYKRPYVILKAAMTLDGRIATATGDSKWITSEESRKMVHELRNQVDAVLVGMGTVIKDNPLLTCRIPGGRDPLRVVVDKDLEIPPDAKCVGKGCLVFTLKDPGERKDLSAKGTSLVRLDMDTEGRIPWDDMLAYLGRMGLHALMVEGGSSINSSILKAGKVDRILAFIAPKIMGGGLPVVDWDSPDRAEDAMRVRITCVKTVGTDALIEAVTRT